MISEIFQISYILEISKVLRISGILEMLMILGIFRILCISKGHELFEILQISITFEITETSWKLGISLIFRISAILKIEISEIFERLRVI